MNNLTIQAAKLRAAVQAAVKEQLAEGNMTRTDARVFIVRVFDETWPKTGRGKGFDG